MSLSYLECNDLKRARSSQLVTDTINILSLILGGFLL